MRWVLYSARKTSVGCYGHVVHRAGLRLGWIWSLDLDYRKESIEPAKALNREVAHVIMKGESIRPEFIRALKGPKVLWYPDQVTGFDERQRVLRGQLPHFDHVFASHLDELEFYRPYVRPGHLHFLPVGACPVYHTNRNPDGPRPVDVGFAGTVDTRSGRIPYLEAFAQAGLPIDRRKVYGEDLMAFYSQCKIVWNLGWGKGGIQTRFFEAMGAGALVVTNETPTETGSPFLPGTHVVTYKDIPDAISNCKRYLEHAVERAQIVANATRKLTEETIDARLQQIAQAVARG